MGTTMADRSGLKFVGFIFATVTLAVMLATGMVVKGYADGAYSLDGAVDRQPHKSSFANHASSRESAAPEQRQHARPPPPAIR